MKLLGMKISFVVAVDAALAGVTIAGVEQVQALLVNWRPLVGGPAAAFVAYFLVKILQITKHLTHNVKWIADKCPYIEQRIDAAAAKSGGVCRH